MKRKFTLHFFTGLFFLLVLCINGQSQCTPAELNWDNLDFLPSNNTRYTTFYPSTAFPYNQNFAMGTRRLNFTMSPQANITLNGENGLHTGHAGSLATAGDDVQFTTTSVASTNLLMTFDADVTNVAFSLFDLDSARQTVTITALNSGGASQNITVGTAIGTSGITIAGSGTATATATAPATAYASTDNRGTINVRIGGPVNRILLTFTTTVGDVWLSDIDACITGTFPADYQKISRPFTGQPQYVLTVVNNGIYYVDPTNGKGYFLFREPGHDRLNSMAYDPYRRIVYYTYSLTDRVGLNPRNDKTLKKYDVDSKTISVVIPNVNTFGIPTYESGVESGAATFYNGSLYLGIEGYTGTTGGGAYAASRKSTIWKIDFDAAGNPIAPASQVWGVTADDGRDAQNIHDWSDFGISNGVLTDFDGSQSGDIDFYHFNMMTGAVTNYAPVGLIPRQVSIGWDEKLYNVDASISLYNGTNGVGPLRTIYAPLGPVIPTGSTASWGDAAGPYRPFLDFGDAPASYDPDPWSPACHDTLTKTVAGTRRKLRLGPNEDLEWLKRGFTTVEDNYEDGLSFIPVFTSSMPFAAQVSVFNNTDTIATLCAWLDYNGNGTFDASESIAPISVPSSPVAQNIWINWPALPTPLPDESYTYLRLRITSAAYNMGPNNATGYYDMGEVEDYRVLVKAIVLPVDLLSFNAEVEGKKKGKLKWSAKEDIDFDGYEIERSADNINWENIAFVPSSGQAETRHYQFIDQDPFKGSSFYRLKLVHANKPSKYSATRTIRIDDGEYATILLYPNPAVDMTSLQITGDVAGQTARINIIDAKGNRLSEEKLVLLAGTNTVSLAIRDVWQPGLYIVQVSIDEKTFTRKLVLKK
jgi:hypothetical protein